MHLEPALLGNNEQEQHAPLSLEIEHCWQMSGCLIYYVAADMAVYPYWEVVCYSKRQTETIDTYIHILCGSGGGRFVRAIGRI